MEIFIHVEQRYWMEFNKWEHFVNDDCTRSFVSLEVTRTGLPEVFTVYFVSYLQGEGSAYFYVILIFHIENLLHLVLILSFLCR